MNRFPLIRRAAALLAACWLCLSPLCAGADAPEASYTVDFEYVRTCAPDTVAWLYQPGSGIDLPVVYSADEKYYLRRNHNQMYDNGGAIYMTGAEAPDLSAPVVTLRGVNRLNYTLFGLLSEYREPEFYEQHPTFYLITPEGNYQLDVFAGLRAKHSDKESWVVTADMLSQPETLSAVLEKSFMTAHADALPQSGDGWAILTTESYDNSGSRFVIYARKRLLPAADAPAVCMTRREMDSRETQSGSVTAPGVGTWMFYAQNDALWDRLIFEVDFSSRHRPFGDGGCGPTSIAIAIANLVSPEELPLLNRYASEPLGYRFCSCCIGDYHCHGDHVPYRLETPEQFLRYFPLAVAEFAMGNNTFGVQGRQDSFGTNMLYLESICSVYGITISRSREMEDTLNALRSGAVAITCSTGAPFTKRSHFLVMVHADDQYLYMLDPLRRDNYAETDPNGLAEIITPGLVRIPLEKLPYCRLTTVTLLTRTDAEAVPQP